MQHPSDIQYEAFGGPFDGDRFRAGTERRLVVRQFENSRYAHTYDLVQDDDGSRTWVYRGTAEAPRAVRAA